MPLMPNDDDLRAGQAIANWNLAHGAVLNQISAACGALTDACDAAIANPTANTYADVRNAGQALASLSASALATPQSGLAEFDEPRSAGLTYYQQAGEIATDVQPTASGHEAAEQVAILLNEGTALTARATAYTRGLLQRLGY